MKLGEALLKAKESDAFRRCYHEYRETHGLPALKGDEIREGLEHDSEAVEVFCDFLLEKVLPGIR